MHNAETLPEIRPDGAPTESCLPHFAVGMMALVLVGKPVNANQLKAFKPPEMAAKRYEELVAKLPQ